MRKSLQILKDNGLRLRRDKYIFATWCFEYEGHLLMSGSTKCKDSLIKAIENANKLTNKEKVMSHLGLCEY